MPDIVPNKIWGLTTAGTTTFLSYTIFTVSFVRVGLHQIKTHSHRHPRWEANTKQCEPTCRWHGQSLRVNSQTVGRSGGQPGSNQQLFRREDNNRHVADRVLWSRGVQKFFFKKFEGSSSCDHSTPIQHISFVRRFYDNAVKRLH